MYTYMGVSALLRYSATPLLRNDLTATEAAGPNPALPKQAFTSQHHITLPR